MKHLRTFVPVALVAAAVVLIVFGSRGVRQVTEDSSATDNVSAAEIADVGNQTGSIVYTVGQNDFHIPHRLTPVSASQAELSLLLNPEDLDLEAPEDGGEAVSDIKLRLLKSFGNSRKKGTSELGAKRLLGVRQRDQDDELTWLDSIGLFNFTNGRDSYYFSESYRSADGGPFFAVCVDSRDESKSAIECEVSYWFSRLLFLEYRFDLDHIDSWQSLDFAIRRFVLSALWRDGRPESLEDDVGYDFQGRVFVRLGDKLLRVPVEYGAPTRPGDAVNDVWLFAACWHDGVTFGRCAGAIPRIDIYLKSNAYTELPELDGDALRDKRQERYKWGPGEFGAPGLEVYWLTPEGNNQLLMLNQKNETGLFIHATCDRLSCRSDFIYAPGMSVMYRFKTTHPSKWPDIDRAVRNIVSKIDIGK